MKQSKRKKKFLGLGCIVLKVVLFRLLSKRGDLQFEKWRSTVLFRLGFDVERSSFFFYLEILKVIQINSSTGCSFIFCQIL